MQHFSSKLAGDWTKRRPTKASHADPGDFCRSFYLHLFSGRSAPLLKFAWKFIGVGEVSVRQDCLKLKSFINRLWRGFMV